MSDLGRVLERYVYVNPDGSPAFSSTRHEGSPEESKPFRQWSPCGNGGWILGRNGAPYVLYRLDRLLAPENAGKPVLVVEGEKDVHTAERLGFLATTNVGGAGKWRPEYNEALRGHDVYALGDNDDPGRSHAVDVAAGAHSVGCRTKVIHLPGLAEKGDLTDWVDAGGTREQLEAIIEATPDWSPTVVDVAEESPTKGLPELDPAALWGLPGDFVQLVEPHTEADPAALLAQFIVACGNMLGANGYVFLGGSRHFPRTNTVVVGASSKARKGTSYQPIEDVIHLALHEDESLHDRVASGLSSGEGLIWAVRDPIEKREAIREKKRVVGYQTVIDDEGVADKRKLIVEPEFASVLKIAERQGNTLSAVIRMAYDSGNLGQLVKNTAAKATGAHVSIIGHITVAELRRYLTATEMANGLANRFLWVFAARRRVLAWGGAVPEAELRDIAKRLARAVDWAHGMVERNGGEPFLIPFDAGAAAVWEAVYPDLSAGSPGLRGAVTARGEANVVRMAVTFAQLDRSPVIRAEDLRAALAVWEYTEESVCRVFGDALGDPVADRILEALRDSADGLSRTEISNLFGRHKTATEIDQALRTLLELGRIREVTLETGGRPKRVIQLLASAA